MENQLAWVHVQAFEETLPSSLRNSVLAEEKLLSSFIHPYLAEHEGLVLKAGERFQSKEVDFKVVSCKPPCGRVTKETKVRALGKPYKLEPLNRLHILPTQASLDRRSPGDR
jgi:hypothetical protein